MALHGGGHLELKKMHKGDFWGIFGIRLGRCPCIILEKISFLQFYSRFNPNALALLYRCMLSLEDESMFPSYNIMGETEYTTGILYHSKNLEPALIFSASKSYIIAQDIEELL